MPHIADVDATLLWPRMTLVDVEQLRDAEPMGFGDDPSIACPRCGGQAFLSADSQILYCPWTCQRALPGPASYTLLQQLRDRHRHRRRRRPSTGAS